MSWYFALLRQGNMKIYKYHRKYIQRIWAQSVKWLKLEFNPSKALGTFVGKTVCITIKQNKTSAQLVQWFCSSYSDKNSDNFLTYLARHICSYLFDFKKKSLSLFKSNDTRVKPFYTLHVCTTNLPITINPFIFY